MYRRWFSVPPRDEPAEVLRWVRRMALVGVVFALLVAARLAVEGDSVGAWVLVGAAGVSFLSLPGLARAIRSIEERDSPPTAEELESGRRRGRRAMFVMQGATVVALTAVGYAGGGLSGAVILLAIALAIALGSLLLWRRWYER